MNAKQFLQVGGGILVLIAVLGFVGIIGPTPEQSLFGQFWWFDTAENVAHLVLGVVGLFASYTLDGKMQKQLVMLLGILGVVVGLYSLLINAGLLGANLENPADTVLHLGVGGWALWAALNTK